MLVSKFDAVVDELYEWSGGITIVVGIVFGIMAMPYAEGFFHTALYGTTLYVLAVTLILAIVATLLLSFMKKFDD